MKIETLPLNSSQRELMVSATSLLTARSTQGKHHIASALRTSDGRVFRGLHIAALVGANSICAETAAIGQSQLDGPATIAAIVTVRATFDISDSQEVVLPCGVCRERILQFGVDARVLIQDRGELCTVRAADLMPMPFLRRKTFGEPPA